MPTKSRKTVTMVLTVSVPVDMSAAEARREVRTLVNEQCNYSADEGDVKVRQLRPALAAQEPQHLRLKQSVRALSSY